MDVDRMKLARARLALREASRGWLFDPNVTLIDFGFPEKEGEVLEDRLAIRFHVRKKLRGPVLEAAAEAGMTRPIPPQIGEFERDVQEGIFVPQQWWNWSNRPPNPRAWRSDPLSGGLSISIVNHNAAGTLGGMVVDRATGKEMFLSNWHVLVANWFARPGQRICQPGGRDRGTHADTVGMLTRDAMAANLDAAVAALNGSRRIVNDQIELGPVRGVGKATPGMEVVKSGRTTGVTSGRVTSVIPGVAAIRYAGVSRIIRHIHKVEPGNRFEQVSEQGDSGSWWIDKATLRVVGLHFAGEYPEVALFMDMQAVLDALNVEVVTAVDRLAMARTRWALGARA